VVASEAHQLAREDDDMESQSSSSSDGDAPGQPPADAAHATAPEQWQEQLVPQHPAIHSSVYYAEAAAQEQLPPRQPATTRLPHLNQPIWQLPNGVCSEMTLGALTRELYHVGELTSMTKHGMILMNELIRKCLPKGNIVPNYRQTENSMLAACAVKAREHAVCPQDHSMIQVPLAELKPKQVASIADPGRRAAFESLSKELFSTSKPTTCGREEKDYPFEECRAPYVDGKGRPIKVRPRLIRCVRI
jgi:hypothetical protein